MAYCLYEPRDMTVKNKYTHREQKQCWGGNKKPEHIDLTTYGSKSPPSCLYTLACKNQKYPSPGTHHCSHARQLLNRMVRWRCGEDAWLGTPSRNDQFNGKYDWWKARRGYQRISDQRLDVSPAREGRRRCCVVVIYHHGDNIVGICVRMSGSASCFSTRGYFQIVPLVMENKRCLFVGFI